MHPLLLKLNVKSDPLLIVGASDALIKELRTSGVTIHTAPINDRYTFILVFGFMREALDQLANLYITMLAHDGVFWLAYPKKTSKTFESDCNRNALINILPDYRSVRMISIDDDFSAIRYRLKELVK